MFKGIWGGRERCFTWNKGQKTEDRSQKAEGRNQRVEDRRQKSEGRGQKTEEIMLVVNISNTILDACKIGDW